MLKNVQAITMQIVQIMMNRKKYKTAKHCS